MQTLYLAGPINGCTDDEARGWRTAVKAHLSGLYEFLDPMDRDYRGNERGHAQDIVQGDLAEIARCDAVLWNRWKASEGSSMEMPYARMLGKPVYLISSDYDLSPWVEYHTIVRFPTVEVACGWFAEQKIGARPSPIRLRRATTPATGR